MKTRLASAALVLSLLGACTGATPTSSPPAHQPTAAPATPTAQPTASPAPSSTVAASPTTTPTAPAGATVGTTTLSEDRCEFEPSGSDGQAGFVVDVVNDTDDDAGFDLWLLNPGSTYDDWLTYHDRPFTEMPGPPFSIATDVDLMEKVGPGSTGSLTADVADPGTYALQCWRFDGDEVLLLTTAGPIEIGEAQAAGPAARGYHAMVDVPGSGVLLFGGFNTSPPQGGHLLSDFWTFDADTGWQRLEGECDFDLCVDGYPDVVGLAFYDPRAEKIVLINDTGRGTFRFDMQPAVFEDLGVTGPAGAAGAALGYDSESGLAVLFGGLDFSDFSVNNDTWTFDPGSAEWTQMQPAEAPGIGNYHLMAYDPPSDRMILFGGTSSSGVAYGETWAYDANTDTWTNLEPESSPPARYYSDMVYDPVRRQMVLFGGTSQWASATLDDTWVYDPATNEWTEIDVPGPSVRAWHSMAYDDETGKIVLFGGGHIREDYQADTWLFDPATGTWSEFSGHD